MDQLDLGLVLQRIMETLFWNTQCVLVPKIALFSQLATKMKLMCINGMYLLILAWRPSRGDPQGRSYGGSENVKSLCISPDGRLLFTGLDGGSINKFDLSSGTCIATLNGHTSTVSSLCISPNGRFLISGSEDQSVKAWHI